MAPSGADSRAKHEVVPRPKPSRPLPLGGFMLSCLWICLGLLSFLGWATSLYRYTAQYDAVAERLWKQVPRELFEWQLAAFGAVLLLNLINLQFSYDTTRYSCNLLLVYINSIAFLTDWLISKGLTPTVEGATGQMFHPLRYIQWAHTTPTLLVMLSLLSDLSHQQVVIAVVSDVVMILTGMAASWLSGPWQVINAILSFATFLPVLYYVHQALAGSITASTDVTSTRMLRSLCTFCLLVWSAFPVVWLLGFLNIIGPMAEQVGWGLCDYMAKAVFSSQLWQSNLMTIAQRRDMARTAVETAERVLVVDRLQQLLASKDELVHGLTHDLRGPVQAIIALANDLIKSSQGAPAASKRGMMAIKSSALCLLNMINATLGAAMARTGELRLALRPANLVQLVGGVVELIRPLLQAGVTLSNQIPQDLPLVFADRRRLAQVLFNLLGNAIRSTVRGSITITAALQQHEEKGRAPVQVVQVQIQDTGEGIPQAKLARIMSSKGGPGNAGAGNSASLSECSGEGLGLYLMRQFLEAIGSTLDVSSREHIGTTITFSLPVTTASDVASYPDSEDELGTAHKASHPPSHASAESHSPGTPTKRASLELPHRPSLDSITRPPSIDAIFKRPSLEMARQVSAQQPQPRSSLEADRAASPLPSPSSITAQAARKMLHREKHKTIQVLSVDDDLINQVVAETVLKSQKWGVVKAMNGPAALDHIAKAEVLPDLVLLDIMMPGMSGLQVCSKLREVYPSSVLPIMMVSAKSEEEDMVEALNRGADDYITKPYKRNELAARIRAHLRTRDAQRAQVEQDLGWALAHNLLPKDIQRKLREGQTVIWEQQERGAVLRMDVVGLEAQAASSDASALVVTLNNLVAELDLLCEKHKVVSLDFDGSSYTLMASPGMACRQQCEQLLNMAQEMLTITSDTQWPGGVPLQLKVGISCGRLLSGVVGSKALKYTVLGEPMAEACLLATACHPGCICLTGQVAAYVMGCTREELSDTGPFVAWRQIEGLTGEQMQAWLHRSHAYEDALAALQRDEMESVLRLESFMSTASREAIADAAEEIIGRSTGSARVSLTGGWGRPTVPTQIGSPTQIGTLLATAAARSIMGNSGAAAMDALAARTTPGTPSTPKGTPGVGLPPTLGAVGAAQDVALLSGTQEKRILELETEVAQLKVANGEVAVLAARVGELATQNETLRDHISSQRLHITDLQASLANEQSRSQAIMKQLNEGDHQTELRGLWREAMELRQQVLGLRAQLTAPTPTPAAWPGQGAHTSQSSISAVSSPPGPFDAQVSKRRSFFRRFGASTKHQATATAAGNEHANSAPEVRVAPSSDPGTSHADDMYGALDGLCMRMSDDMAPATVHTRR